MERQGSSFVIVGVAHSVLEATVEITRLSAVYR